MSPQPSFSATDALIDKNSIKDCHRLGKYNVQSDRSRPLLVKFLRYTDASSIIRNKTKLASQIYVKPHLTPNKRTIESLLLKERKSIIEKKNSRRHIKIRNSCLHGQNKVHAKVATKSPAFCWGK